MERRVGDRREERRVTGEEGDRREKRRVTGEHCPPPAAGGLMECLADGPTRSLTTVITSNGRFGSRLSLNCLQCWD